VLFLFEIGCKPNNYGWILYSMTWHVMVLMLACSPDLNTKKDSGNFPHQHTILALKKDTLNSWTNNQLNNLIATNVMEIVKPDEIAKHIADGLLSCPEDIHDIV